MSDRFAALVVAACAAGFAHAADPVDPPGQVEIRPVARNAGRSPEFVVAPIPISNPTIGSGLGVAGMMLYKVDPASPTSFTGLGAAYTDSESYGAGIVQRTYLAGDRFRIGGYAGRARLNYNFYGIGPAAGSAGRSIPIEQRATAIVPDASVKVADHTHLGVRFRYADVETRVPALGQSFAAVEQIQVDVVTSGLGLIASYDTRDQQLNPATGVLLDFKSNFARKALGSTFNYETYTFAANFYTRLPSDSVLALRVSACRAGGSTPFFDLCLFGTGGDLRGYVGGQYRDRAMVALQGEARIPIYGRFGAIAFAGVGAVAPSFGKITDQAALPAAGVGLRYLASRRERVNLSVDYAWGKASSAFYVYIGEAF
jgi:outer membrane protein assembly factor BamA